MTSIQQFYNKEFGSLNILLIDNQPFFPATECARILGYSNPQYAIRSNCKGVRKILTPTNGGRQAINHIPEGDLYSLILHSTLPAARKFERWICDFVLPSLRKHGAYMTDEVLEKASADEDFALKLLEKLQAEKKKNAALNKKLEEAAPKVYYCDVILQSKNAVPISLIAKDYGMTAAAFNTLLHNLKIQYKVSKTWLLYQKYAKKGYTKTRTFYINNKMASVITCWTQKGRMFLYELLKEYGILPLLELDGDFYD